jgi:hypothetical protein
MSEPSAKSKEKVNKLPPMTDAQIKDVAMGMFKCQIFTSDMVDNPKDIGLVFMVMTLADADYVKFLKDNDVTLFYEHYHAAGPMCINGMPTFFSCSVATRADHKRILDRYQIIKTAIDAADKAT